MRCKFTSPYFRYEYEFESYEDAEPPPVTPAAEQLRPDDYVGDASDRTGFSGLEAVDEVTMVAVPDLMAAYEKGAIDLESVQAVQLAMIAHCELMGDRIAILRPGGRLAQYDTPEVILAHPADEFVADFVGADRGLKRLSLTRLDELELAPVDGAEGPALEGSTTLRDALSAMLSEGSRVVVVLDGDGRPRGSLSLDALSERLVS